MIDTYARRDPRNRFLGQWERELEVNEFNILNGPNRKLIKIKIDLKMFTV